MKTNRQSGHGMVLGKFLPPHYGHVYLVEFAKNFIEDLTVVVGTLEAEPIPGELRFTWMRELFPEVRMVHLKDENPQDPSEHPDFWKIWEDSLTRILPYKPDVVFASESYGPKLAKVLGADFIPVDPDRTIRPVSGTSVREDPLGNWEYLPPCVRLHYLRKVCVFGPESTGKSTLVKRLAKHFDTIGVPEYARTYLEQQNGELHEEDLLEIARGQAASEDALTRYANKVIITDTDVLATTVWSEFLYGRCDPWIVAEADRRTYDLYLLTDVDVPWVADQVRYLPTERESFFEKCVEALERKGRKFVRLSGSWDERFQTACGTVDGLLV